MTRVRLDRYELQFIEPPRRLNEDDPAELPTPPRVRLVVVCDIFGVPSREEIEAGLVELARAMGEESLLIPGRLTADPPPAKEPA